MRFIPAAVLAIASLTPLAAMADEDPKELAIEARQGYFVMLGANMGQLAGMAKGDIAYDEAAAATAGANIEALSKYTVGMHFMPGTAKGEMDDTDAKPEIWTDMAGFSAKFADFQNAAAGASEAVKGGQGNVGPVVQKLGGTCKACHDSFRAAE
ncbi:cytochrome c [Paracoccus sp. p4-l81]|uniref:c-type cytochrome n=1 Tax=unclassified Paracoccus (in: a-proteobacteria) TaxID=2688777 RepID=UPI0035BA25DE